MELVANVWPVFDGATRLVLRYFARAYAINAPDDIISSTLLALAPTDYLLARPFPIPQRFAVASPYGEIRGCLTLSDFHEYQSELLAPAFAALERDFAQLQGVAVSPESDQPTGIGRMPRFPAEPYVLFTALLETPDGRLLPQTRS
jgi:hypothetical protein